MFLTAYVLYFVVARVVVLLRGGETEIPRPFTHMWFFLLPGLLFLFVFPGLAEELPHWQAPLAPFVAIGTALGILLIGDVFRAVHHLLGRSVVGVLVIVLVVFCNQGLSEYRAVRSQSPCTIDLFKKLNWEIPPDKALLTFKDLAVWQHGMEQPTYRPEYAWYLDREMVVANAWHYNPEWGGPAQLEEVIGETIKEIQQQARTGRFAYFLILAKEHPEKDPESHEYGGEQAAGALQRLGLAGDSALQGSPLGENVHQKRQPLASLDLEELERRLNDRGPDGDEVLYWEKHRRYRETVIARLKELYAHEYYTNPALPGDPNFDPEGNTPCYLFDLANPKQ